MPDTQSDRRRISDDLVLDKLENLRISSDASLKGVNDLKMDILRMESKFAQALAEEAAMRKAESVRTDGIDERLDAWVKWFVGIVTLVVGLAVKAFWDFFTAGGTAPHK